MTRASIPTRRLRRVYVVGAAAALLSVATAGWPTEADARSRGDNDRAVSVCSHYGHGCVTGPVRQGRVETQVRMPGGTWIGCKGNCRRTLREESLDFFETLRDRVHDN